MGGCLRPHDSLWDGAHDARLTGDVVDEILGGKVDRADWSGVPDDLPQKPASAPPRTCRTAPNISLHVEDLPRTSLSAGRRRAALTRQAAPSPRAKATIGASGAWRVAVVCMGALMHGITA